MSSDPAVDLFDVVARWRADAALALGLRGDDLIAAVSPGPAYPAVLRTLASAFQPSASADSTLVDLGAGMGGASAWLAARTGAHVIAVEPAPGSREAARQLFPELDVREGTAQRSGLPDGCADMVVALGVTSLLGNLGDLIDEALRVARPDGLIGIADMFLAEGLRESSGVNTLRSVEFVVAALSDRGLDIEVIGCADDAMPDPSWADAAGRVKQWVLDRHAGDPALDEWQHDQEQLHAWMSEGHVIGACVVCRPPSG